MNNSSKAVLIYNPCAGRGMKLPPLLKKIVGIKHRKSENFSMKQNIDLIIEELKKYGMEVELSPTDGPGKATEIAENFSKKNCRIAIAVGGDGTINEVVNGLAGTETCLGVIPMGTANVFALQMGLHSDIEKACETIAKGNRKLIDLGKINNRYFTCMAGIGFDAHIVNEADKKLKKILGAMAYPATAIKELLFYKFNKISVKIDDERTSEGYMALICNGKFYGGALKAAPHAELDDGLLDICIFKHKNPISVLSYLIGFKFGNIDKLNCIDYFQAKKIEIESNGHSMHADAEYIGATPALIEVAPQTLKVAVP
jgi:YegS/Rv2252/BmrU family lipid kinase